MLSEALDDHDLTGEALASRLYLSRFHLERIVSSVAGEPPRRFRRRLLSRLVGQLGMWNAAMADRDYDWSVEDHEEIAAMRERLASEGPTYLAQVREVGEVGRLDDTFVDATCTPAEVFTYGGMIAHVLTFAAYRRCLVVMALAHHGVDDLGLGDPIRWVAEPVA